MPDRQAAPAGAATSGPERAGPRSEHPPIERLRRSQDFRATMRSGKRARHPLLHLVARENGLPVTRAGLSVSRRVGGSVVRNLVKRRLREILRSSEVTPGFDVVTIAQPLAAQATFQELSEAVEQCLGRLKLGGTGGERRGRGGLASSASAARTW